MPAASSWDNGRSMLCRMSAVPAHALGQPDPFVFVVAMIAGILSANALRVLQSATRRWLDYFQGMEISNVHPTGPLCT